MKNYILLPLILWFNSLCFANAFTIESTAFKTNSLIPDQYTCKGADNSPPLSWQDAPPKTKSFVLIVDDPTASDGVWTHWILFNIPPTVTSLETATPVPDGATNSKNSWGNSNYRGPCPPLGMHSYAFKLYAVDKVLNLEESATRDNILQAITGHVLGTAELIGLYQK